MLSRSILVARHGSRLNPNYPRVRGCAFILVRIAKVETQYSARAVAVEDRMITERFNSRTMANMEVALEWGVSGSLAPAVRNTKPVGLSPAKSSNAPIAVTPPWVG